MVANLVIAAAKFLAAAMTGSSAMLSEGIHSVADTGNEVLLLIGDRFSRRAPDTVHPFGHGRELYFWSLVVAMVLFGMGGGLSIYEGISHLRTTRDQQASGLWNYAVLGVAFIAETTSLTVTLREFRRIRGDRSLWRAFRDSKDPRLFVPLAEDVAALLGLTIALLGVALSRWFDRPAIDGIASILIGSTLGVVALLLARETRSLLVGEPANERVLHGLRSAAAADQAVAAIGRMLTIHNSPESILLNVEVCFQRELSAAEVAEAIRRLKRRIAAAEPRISRIFVEIHVSALRDDSCKFGEGEQAGP